MSDQTTTSYLDSPIEYLKGVGPQRGEVIKKELDIFTIGELLTHYPFRYIDRTRICKINELHSDSQDIQVNGKVTTVTIVGKNRGKRMVATLQDETGTIELVWFKGIQWISNIVKPGLSFLAFGKPTVFNRKLNMAHPELTLASSVNQELLTGFQPVYHTTEKLKAKGLDSRGLSKLTKNIFDRITGADIPENLPVHLKEKFKLIGRFGALKGIHSPKSKQDHEQAKWRLVFEELFYVQLRVLLLKLHRQQKGRGFVFPKISNHFDSFFKNYLPFKLTEAQKRVLREIRSDVVSGKQMNRLLQGDVGSGKTVVAVMTMLMAIDNDYQVCLMAPTEILAQQHFHTISKFLNQLPLAVELLTGSVKGKARKAILEELQEGRVHVLIGTHALIEDPVVYKNLGCVIIDEQHRFGVTQRAKLWGKNVQPPHVLVMTATPIPRSLAMTVYGDLDVSVIDELPPGRKQVQTLWRKESHRLKMFSQLKKEIELGRQVYIVYPLIYESEKLDYKDLMDGYESICRAFPMPEFRVSVVHGQMKSADKDFEMNLFKEGKTHIMVATTVIEVGVDVPNASVMMIESAERFGLSQLHQLRGRVGRGADQSFCILMSSFKLSKEAKKRLEIMVATTDGFKIAEEDLKIRGPGDIEGTRQSGMLDLKIANIVNDRAIMTEARAAAIEILKNDPNLVNPKNQTVRQYLVAQKRKMGRWGQML